MNFQRAFSLACAIFTFGIGLVEISVHYIGLAMVLFFISSMNVLLAAWDRSK